MAKFGFPGFPWAPRVPEAHMREAGGSAGRPDEATLTLPTLSFSALKTLRKASLILPGDE